MSNKLILRTQASPYGDETKGSVLSQAELDNNFIFLKGLDINTVNLDGTTLQLNRLNGDILSVSLDNFVGPSGPAGADGPAGPAGPAGADGSGGGGSVTAATYNNSLGILSLENSDNTTINVNGFFTTSDDKYVNSFTFNTANFDLTIARNDGWSETRSLSILASDMTVTGGTYSSTTGIVTFTTNSGNTFQVSGFTSGYTNIYTSAATYNSVNGDINLSFTDPSKNLTITGVTSIYNGNGSLQTNRIVDLSGKTLSFSSSTNPNTLVMSGGNVGIGVSNPTSKLHVSAATNPVKIEGFSNISGSSKVVGIDSSNQLQIFTGNTNSVPYFLNGSMVTSSRLTFTTGTTNILNIGTADGPPYNGASINFVGGRGTINFPNSAGGDMTFQVGLTTPFDGSKGFTFKNGGTKLYLLFDSEGGFPIGSVNAPAGAAYGSGHTATFGTTLIVNTSVDGLGYGTTFWGTSGIVTRTVANTYVDTTTAATGTEIVGSSFGVPTFSSYTGKTYSAMTNVYIAGAPIVGTSASTLFSYALKVNTGTTYFGGDVTLSGISTGTTSQLLTRESNGNISFRNLGDVGVISSGDTTLYWYDENNTPPDTRPLATGTGSIALGNAARALSASMFVFGLSAGTSATNASGSTFIGDRAGYGATNANGSFFFGNQAGYQSTNASSSIFMGDGAGSNAASASGSIFIGGAAGLGGTSSSNSIMIGSLAGYQATSASNAQFIGSNAGRAATTADYSSFIGTAAGFSATGATSSQFIGRQAGSGATDAANSTFIGEDAGKNATGATSSFFVGYKAGENSSTSMASVFIGQYAGQSAVTDNGGIIMIGHNAGQTSNNATYSVSLGYQAAQSITNGRSGIFIGYQAGQSSIYATSSVMIGANAGNGLTGVTNTNAVIIGNSAGLAAHRATDAVMIGEQAGYQATNASFSNFMGYQAGYQAKSSSNSIMIGSNAGDSATGLTNAIFIGKIAGNQVANSSNAIMIGTNAGSGSSASNNTILIGNSAGLGATYGNNNIIIGTNISLTASTVNSFNIGGVLFGAGTNSTTTGGAVSSAITGSAVSIGINKPNDSAILDLTSTSKGFLPPRMTGTQAAAISSKAEGLMVYVTDTSGGFASKGWWGWDGASWTQLG